MENNNKASILVVDDEEEVADTLRDYLELSGFKTAKETSPIRAMRLVAELKPELVILDIKMPELDGISLLKKLKRLAPRLKVILITGFHSEYQEEIRRLKRLRLIQAVILKPFDYNELVGTVRELLGPSEKEESAVKKPKILVVDDEKSIRYVMEEAFTRAGFSVEAAQTGEEAMRKADLFKPDVALVDVMLVGKDGFWLMDELRRKHKKTLVYVMTARKDEEVTNRILQEFGPKRFFRKPFDLEDVEELAKSMRKELKKASSR